MPPAPIRSISRKPLITRSGVSAAALAGSRTVSTKSAAHWRRKNRARRPSMRGKSTRSPSAADSRCSIAGSGTRKPMPCSIAWRPRCGFPPGTGAHGLGSLPAVGERRSRRGDCPTGGRAVQGLGRPPLVGRGRQFSEPTGRSQSSPKEAQDYFREAEKAFRRAVELSPRPRMPGWD